MKKVLLFLVIGISILAIGILMAFKYGAYFIIDKGERESIIKEIEASPELSDRFYEIYNVISPNSLTPSSILHYFNHQVDDHSYCACREAVYEAIYPKHTRTFEMMPIVSFVESKINQKKCLDYYVQEQIKKCKIDSYSLFGRSIADLEDEEIIRLILVLKNSSLYNNDKYADKTQNRINEILDKLNK